MKKKLSEKERTIHGQFMQYGQNVREWMEKCKRLLPLIDEYKIWEKKGFSSIHEYAGKLAGMGRSQVNDALCIYRKIETFPVLAAVAERKGLNSVKPILGIITNGTQDFWGQKANSMTKNDLETYVREYRKRGLTEDGGAGGSCCAGGAGAGSGGTDVRFLRDVSRVGLRSVSGNTDGDGLVQQQNVLDNSRGFESNALQVGGLPRKSDE